MSPDRVDVRGSLDSRDREQLRGVVSDLEPEHRVDQDPSEPDSYMERLAP